MSTKQFLDTFFQGKWSLYGHFTFTILLACMFSLLLPAWLAGIVAFIAMFVLEMMPFNNFNIEDIKYNTFGTVAFLAFNLIKELI